MVSCVFVLRATILSDFIAGSDIGFSQKDAIERDVFYDSLCADCSMLVPAKQKYWFLISLGIILNFLFNLSWLSLRRQITSLFISAQFGFLRI